MFKWPHLPPNWDSLKTYFSNKSFSATCCCWYIIPRFLHFLLDCFRLEPQRLSLFLRSFYKLIKKTRLNAFTRSCLFNASAFARGDTVPENRCWQIAGSRNFQCFNRIVHRRSWVKVHKIFHTCRAPRGLFTVKVWRAGGLQQKILRESPKTGNFCTCTCKSAHCVYLKGQGRTYTL